MTARVLAELDQAVDAAMEHLIAVQTRQVDVTDPDAWRSWREDMFAAERAAATVFARVQKAVSYADSAAWWSAQQAKQTHEDRAEHWRSLLDRERQERS